VYVLRAAILLLAGGGALFAQTARAALESEPHPGRDAMPHSDLPMADIESHVVSAAAACEPTCLRPTTGVRRSGSDEVLVPFIFRTAPAQIQPVGATDGLEPGSLMLLSCGLMLWLVERQRKSAELARVRVRDNRRAYRRCLSRGDSLTTQS